MDVGGGAGGVGDADDDLAQARGDVAGGIEAVHAGLAVIADDERAGAVMVGPERHAEFADAMENHNNREVAELFRKLARIEHKHAEQILEEMRWTAPPQPPVGGYQWEGLEGPESQGES